MGSKGLRDLFGVPELPLSLKVVVTERRLMAYQLLTTKYLYRSPRERQRRFHVRINHLSFQNFAPVLLVLAIGLFCSIQGQTNSVATASIAPEQQTAKPTVVLQSERGAPPVAGPTNLLCGGFIQYAPAPNDRQIVGGEEEQEQRVYSQGDYVYINTGARDGVREGEEFLVVRPRGQYQSKRSSKSGWLGVYTQEVGIIRVVKVKDVVSVAMVKVSCDNLLLGDLLRAAPQRVAPLARAYSKFDRFADPSGKQNGRIVLARDGREILSKDQVVFIDLGSEDNVKPGDYLTIYRPVGHGNITHYRDDEVSVAATSGFESEEYKGGQFSNKSQRVKEANTTGIYGPTVSTPGIWAKRPPMPRKIVGELVVLSVQQRTATAVITVVAQEILTGDFVEVQ